MGAFFMESEQINFRENNLPGVHTVKEALLDLYNTLSLLPAVLENFVTKEELASGYVAKSTIAPTFDDATNYHRYDLVYYAEDGELYEFQADHTAGPWETSEVLQKDLSDILTGYARKQAGGEE